jgi:hypothetical protein
LSFHTQLHLEWSWLGGVEAGPFLQALVIAAGSVGKSVFSFFSDLTWVLRNSGVLQCRPIMFPWGVKDAIRGHTTDTPVVLV